MRALILGVTGMLGHAVFDLFSDDAGLDVWGTLRQPDGLRFFSDARRDRLLTGVDVLDVEALSAALNRVRPDVVVNCVGVIKQLPVGSDPLVVLPINAKLPHRLTQLCASVDARLIHISTDCVFSGRRGGYRESDPADTTDLYGQSKYMGEVRDVPHVLTLRSSFIGHELSSRNSLVDWFLSQKDRVSGYRKAIFSGLPAVEFARVLRDVVLPRRELHGLYHVSAKAITKYELLGLIAAVYDKRIDIVPDDTVVIDRSLNSERFTQATGYVAPEWPALVNAMHASSGIRVRNLHTDV